MKIPISYIDAFSRNVFHGNPAAVCHLEAWLPDPILQSIAAENNLSETAFWVDKNGPYEIRWFTPKCEIDLCGHATLATAHSIFATGILGNEISFHSKSGMLKVTKNDQLLTLDFPAREAVSCPIPKGLCDALGREPTEVLVARDYLAVFESEADVCAIRPNMDQLTKLDVLGVIVTAPGKSSDFVSRFFAPAVGVPEDPVTGSAHCTLIPYWSNRLAKKHLFARQLSARGGELYCEHRSDRVFIGGFATSYLEGWIEVPNPA